MKQKIGEVGVDSGLLMITDPCYASKVELGENDSFNPLAWTAVHPSEDDNGEMFGKMFNKLAITFHTPFGDGIYPVYGVFGSDGTLKRVVIDFDEG